MIILHRSAVGLNDFDGHKIVYITLISSIGTAGVVRRDIRLAYANYFLNWCNFSPTMANVADKRSLIRTPVINIIRVCFGLMEFAGVDKTARSKMGVWKMQEWTVDILARCGRGGQCRSGLIGTVWQGWTMREKKVKNVKSCKNEKNVKS